LFILFSQALHSQSKDDCNALLKTADSLYYSNPDSSYSLSKKALNFSILKKDKTNEAKALSYIGRYLLLKSDLEESNKKLNESLAIYKELNDAKGIGYILRLKSNLQKRLGNIQEAIALHEESIENYKKANSVNGVNNTLINLILDYFAIKDYKKAEEALKEIEKNKDSLSKTGVYFFHQNKGLLFLYTSKINDAIEQFNIALAAAQKNKMIDSEATILKLLGSAYRQNKNFQKADYLLKQSQIIATNNKLDHELIETYEEIILLNNDLENYKIAFETLKLQNELKNKIINIEKINRIAFLEKKLAVSEKEKQIESEKLNSQKAKAQTQTLVYVLIAVAFILLLIVYLFIKTSSLKNKIAVQNNKLEEQNAIVESQNNILEMRQKEIMDSIHYAQRIQQSLLPTEKYIAKNLKK
jgi:tetratricopeptide (TPR) repeat protein